MAMRSGRLERLVDYLIDRVFQCCRRRQRGEIGDPDLHRRRNADALRQRYLCVTFSLKHILQIEGGLSFLLPGERNVRDSRQPFTQLCLRRFADSVGRIDGALGNRDFCSKAG